MSSAVFIVLLCFFFNDTATTEIYTLSLHDALPISPAARPEWRAGRAGPRHWLGPGRDRKSTRLNSSHANISYAVFCLKKKNPPRLAPREEQQHDEFHSFRRHVPVGGEIGFWRLRPGHDLVEREIEHLLVHTGGVLRRDAQHGFRVGGRGEDVVTGGGRDHRHGRDREDDA